MTDFDFLEFARRVYAECGGAHAQQFLLPALYGGTQPATYEAAFVLESPSVSFTEKRWQRVNSSSDAVQAHRRIFHEWAYTGKARILFDAVDRAVLREISRATASRDAFFDRYYITDIWKDDNFRRDRSARYRDYWTGKLREELHGIATRRVIFIGREAEKAKLATPIGVPTHYLPFPGQWIAVNTLQTEVARLLNEFRSERETP
jgi:hypothetical protein